MPIAAPRPESWIRAIPGGLYCEPGDFFIDPTQPVDRAVVTHGHGDHARPGNRNVLATPETLAIMQARYGEAAGGSLQALRYCETVTISTVSVTLVPAGHVLGSAQAVLDYRGSRVVVSGDYKRRRDPTCALFEPQHCDVFITEATFGLPVFRHPPDRHEIGRLLHSLRLFPERCQLVGVYALGKCQRVIALLREAGYDAPIYLHSALIALCGLYERFGVALGPLLPVAGVAKAELAGKIVLAPPGATADRWSRRLPDPVSAMASGWMRVKQRAKARGIELPLVISDHADWDELTATLADVGAPEIWVTHGNEEALVHYATGIGLKARALALVGYEDEELNRFAELIDGLLFTPSRNGKLRLMEEYFGSAPDPERGWALAALTGELSFAAAKPSQVRALAMARVDTELFAWSLDFVGDLAETVSLIWPEPSSPEPSPSHAARGSLSLPQAGEGLRTPAPKEAPLPQAGEGGSGRSPETGEGMPLSLSEIVETLHLASRADVGAHLAGWLDRLDSTGRWALLKLVTGSLRIGVSARLAKVALAEWSGQKIEEIEEIWHGLAPPYRPLFAWLDGNAPRPEIGGLPNFTPLMLAQPLDEDELAALDAAAYFAEWKWDGIRVQLVARHGERRVYSRSGDEIGPAFPDIVAALPDDIALDGELLVIRDGEVAPFNDLQQRLNRKTPTPKMLSDYPASVRLYDMLRLGDEDLRALPLGERRHRLDTWYGNAPRDRLDLSPLVPFECWDDLKELRDNARANGIEGLMLKRRDSPYLSGRPKGPWFKWKRGALTIDAVLMYAQRGHGKRSSFYSDYTFGAWRDDALVPVGKAYSGFTDDELRLLDKWVRDNTVKRYGPVREVSPGLVLEIAFDSVHRSTRHKSGVAMRFPRVHRIRWDKPFSEADTLENLERMMT